MKKFLMVVLLICMIPISAFCGEADAQTTYLLWDIPFDADLETIKTLLAETKGIKTLTTTPSDGNNYIESIVGLDTYVLFDRPISLRVYKHRNGSANQSQIMFSPTFASTEVTGIENTTILMEKLTPLFDEYFNIRDQVKKIYGNPTGGRLRVVQGTLLFNYPVNKKNEFDAARVLAAVEQFPDVYLETDFNNVCLWMRIAKQPNESSFLYNFVLQYTTPNANDIRFYDYELGDFPLETRDVQLAL